MAVKCLDEASGDGWVAYQGDNCQILPQLPGGRVDFTIYSVPFGALFTYSDSEADLGNCADEAEFSAQYAFAVREIYRMIKPGRLCAVHCSDLPFHKWKEGYIATNPFSDLITRVHMECGFQFLRRITIWKDPVVEQTRTNAMNLLYHQLRKDSSKSWPGSPDYICVFRKPGENMVPVEHKPDGFPLEQWQRWASPVWMDIKQTNTLNVRMAKNNSDERHLCPLQLDLIERAIVMWSNKGEVVMSPYMGIGSEGYVALKQKRKFLGVELKDTYFKSARAYLDEADRGAASLMDGLV